jgi:predicted dehydrogenase
MIEKMINLFRDYCASFRNLISKLKNRFLWTVIKRPFPRSEHTAGLVGCGDFVRYAYIPALNRFSSRIACSGLYSRSPKSAQKVANILSYKSNVFGSYEDLVQSGIKSVIITAPNHLHYHYILESFKKGLDVFCEKPVTNTLQEAIHLKTVVDKSDNILMVGFNLRYLDAINKLKALIKSGEAGKVYNVYAYYNINISDYLLRSDWLGDPQKSGGGVVHYAGVHLINILYYLFGKIENVTAEYSNVRMPENYGEDTAKCTFLFQSGVQGLFEASYVNAIRHVYDIIIEAENARVMLDINRSRIKVCYKTGVIKNIYCKREIFLDSVFNELMHFDNCIRTRSIPYTDICDSIETMKIVTALKRSSLDGKDVNV